MLTAANYGYFCDELYTIALSKHPAFGYIDLPPLVPALVVLSRAIFGESLFALHIFPAFAGAATLVFVCLTVKEMGGKLFATGLSALGYIMVPIWLITDSFFCYDCIDQLMLTIFLYFLVKLIRTGNGKLWLLLGFLAGIACMAKVTILLYGPGLLIALLLSKNRKNLGTPWP
jgi:4-amino-4-deoxy-L-arabinose transferase-like glycosyltransferase